MVFIQIIYLLMFDLLFVSIFGMLLLPLGIYRKAAFAIFKRNFVGYFSNPTGYVFLCLFVLLTSVAAFWPHDFFAANLANLDQLNKYIPLIMLVFIPAITMSVWAEEGRQGTDELLLTIPATDAEVVLGKYLAAAAIFTASLLFSQVSSFLVLVFLTYGDVDTGLFVTTYLGYWMIGLAMLSVGMVASFLTRNLTVGFILGAAFNAPLAAAAYANAIIPSTSTAQSIARWSYTAQFADFGRGVVSLSSVTYFLMIVVLGVYLSIVLLGRRHWLSGREGAKQFGHYAVRAMSLVVITVGLNLLFSTHDLIRYDATDGAVASLSDDTKRLIHELTAEAAESVDGEADKIRIEAFISANVPEPYVQTKLEMVSLLNELRALGRGRLDVRIYDQIEAGDEDAIRAEQQYGMQPQSVFTRSRGVQKREEVLLAAGFTYGAEQVVSPFFGPGIPMEYELVRSICTAAQQQRKRIGIVEGSPEDFGMAIEPVIIEPRLAGGVDISAQPPKRIASQLLLAELRKQYDVELVDPREPIEPGIYDVLLVVQPSWFSPQQLENVMNVMRTGQPTAVFEDPLPTFFHWVPGTIAPRRPPSMPLPLPVEPKCDIAKLWKLLGIQMVGSASSGQFEPYIIWQDYNPYRQVEGWSREEIFIAPGLTEEGDALSLDDPITAGLQQLLFPVAGAIERNPRAPDRLKMTELVTTGADTGYVRLADLLRSGGDPRKLLQFERLTNQQYVLAARIQSDEEESKADEDDASSSNINAVYVTDIDLLESRFLRVWAQPGQEVEWRFNNTVFVLNILDSLAGDDRFIEIRKRQPRHSTLRLIEEAAAEARNEDAGRIAQAFQDQQEAEAKAEEEKEDATRAFRNEYEMLRDRQQTEAVDPQLVESARLRLAGQEALAEKKLVAARKQIARDLQKQRDRIERDLDLKIRSVQNRCKFWAVMLPPIPPLVIALVVFARRRIKEREGVSSTRLRK